MDGNQRPKDRWTNAIDVLKAKEVILIIVHLGNCKIHLYENERIPTSTDFHDSKARVKIK